MFLLLLGLTIPRPSLETATFSQSRPLQPTLLELCADTTTGPKGVKRRVVSSRLLVSKAAGGTEVATLQRLHFPTSSVLCLFSLCSRHTVTIAFPRESFKKANCNRYTVAAVFLSLVCDLFVLSLSLGHAGAHTVAIAIRKEAFKKGNCNRYTVANAFLSLDLIVLAVCLSGGNADATL